MAITTPDPTFDPQAFKQTTEQQWQRAAEAWHRWHPLIQSWLGPATEVMLDAAHIGSGSHVLDVAAGAGEPALTAAARVGPTGHVLATDISANILEFATNDAAARGMGWVETKVMDGEYLTLDDARFDAVLSRVGLIYFPDRQGALAEIYRVLKPGGRVAVMVYSTPDHNQFFSIPVGIIRKAAGLGPPAPGLPGPFSLGSPGVLEAALASAGFTAIELHTIAAPVRLASAAECVAFERESFGALHQMLAKLPADEQNAVWDEIATTLAQFEHGGRFSGPCEMLVAAGTK